MYSSLDVGRMITEVLRRVEELHTALFKRRERI